MGKNKRKRQRRSPSAAPDLASLGTMVTAAPSPPGSQIAARLGLRSAKDGASVFLFRICLGMALFWECLQYLTGGLEELFTSSTFFFSYPGFTWLKPWPGSGMVIHFWVLIGLSLAISAGFFYRLASCLFCLGFSYFFLLEQAQYLNHSYLIILLSFLMIFVPAHRDLSVDSRLFPKVRSSYVPAWCLWLLRVQIGIVYVYGGFAKLNHDWLAGEPMRTFLTRSGSELPLIANLDVDRMAYLLSYGGLLLDLLIVPALLWRRSRLWALGIGFVFHLSNALLFHIGVFPWLMMAATLLFLDSDWPRKLRFLPRLKQIRPSTPTQYGRAMPVLLSVYLAIQLVLPLRHFLYSGNASWTEEGQRFAWRMMLRSKWGRAHFFATDPDSGRTWELVSGDVLNPRQMWKMQAHPQMVLDWARQQADRLRKEGKLQVEIRALVLVSLNNHPVRLLVDPRVDLARASAGFGHSEWIFLREDPRSDPASGILNELPRGAQQAIGEALRDAYFGPGGRGSSPHSDP